MYVGMYVIKDWAGNNKISDKRFDTFDDAWDAILAAMPDECTDEDLGEYCVCEDGVVVYHTPHHTAESDSLI